MLDVWTDGSCIGNPGAGGAAAVSSRFTLTYGDASTTNNAMEMRAVIIALEKCLVLGCHDVTIITDSVYVKNGTQKWMANWKKNGWKTATGTAVKNKELWERLDTLIHLMNIVNWRWVKGHSGDPGNEKADSFARKIAEMMQP
jgi:ribonuclease HI